MDFVQTIKITINEGYPTLIDTGEQVAGYAKRRPEDCWDSRPHCQVKRVRSRC